MSKKTLGRSRKWLAHHAQLNLTTKLNAELIHALRTVSFRHGYRVFRLRSRARIVSGQRGWEKGEVRKGVNLFVG